MFVVVLFGARKIPEIMRGLGLGIKEFKSGLKEEENAGNGEDKQEKKPEEKENKEPTSS